MVCLREAAGAGEGLDSGEEAGHRGGRGRV